MAPPLPLLAAFSFVGTATSPVSNEYDSANAGVVVATVAAVTAAAEEAALDRKALRPPVMGADKAVVVVGIEARIKMEVSFIL